MFPQTRHHDLHTVHEGYTKYDTCFFVIYSKNSSAITFWKLLITNGAMVCSARKRYVRC